MCLNVKICQGNNTYTDTHSVYKYLSVHLNFYMFVYVLNVIVLNVCSTNTYIHTYIHFTEFCGQVYERGCHFISISKALKDNLLDVNTNCRQEYFIYLFSHMP